MIKNQNNAFSYLLLILLLSIPNTILSQLVTQEYVKELKKDRRGPYKDIKWFCEDGSIREARDPCPEPMEGVQHARYKDKVQSLADKHNLFLDQILVGTENYKFWDAAHDHSRLKQYQITNFLYDADNGWILEEAKNYRGAKQIEDEMKWGQDFMEWVVADDSRVRENYLLIRLAAKDIPHGEDNRLSQRVRAVSKYIAEVDNSFMDIRTKIHNNPDQTDIDAVQKWADNKELNGEQKERVTTLLTDMEEMYKPFEVQEIEKYSNYLPKESNLKKVVDDFAQENKDVDPSLRAMNTSILLREIRDNFYDTRWLTARVKLIDLTNYLESLLIKDINSWKPVSLNDYSENFCFQLQALYGGGYLEEWEYKKAEDDLLWLQGDYVKLENLEDYKYTTEKLVQWSSQYLQSLYAEPVSEFVEFEPLAKGFVDDRVRSSLILQLGQTVSMFGDFFNALAESQSQIMNSSTGGASGLNPGFAIGELVVMKTLTKDADLDKTKIYAFDRPPADMKPVAGILNVKEGNPVSHVQLLARNLAIPNALITNEVLNDLQKYDGEEVFYAVGPKGKVVLKKTSDMTKEEKKLIKEERKMDKKISISVENLVLDPDSLLDMSKINSSYSGKWCGPKAANLGQLKQLFPDHVVEGVVIPFGIFKDHMLQKMPGQEYSYWAYLQSIFSDEKKMLEDGIDPKDVECMTLQDLNFFRSQMEEIPLKDEFVKNLDNYFQKIFGRSIGNIPVFLRSDTNMEDLPQFTGAGLNLTLFNVLDRSKILDGIKKVWASPYTERSYQWRQQYLNNAEDVYPSILIIPSVNVDKSGVIITKGVSRGDEGDISISFSKGVGGAVEGQSAESYVMYQNGTSELISPGRETKFRTIPATGGSTFQYASLNRPTLTKEDLEALNEMAKKIVTQMDKVTGEQSAYDIELGIKDGKIWLFQVRPFVENSDANTSNYLKSLDPEFKEIYVSLKN